MGLSVTCREGGKIVSCDYALNQIRQGNFESVTYTSSAGASMTVRRADFYKTEKYTTADGIEGVNTVFDNSGFLKAAGNLAGLLSTSVMDKEFDSASVRPRSAENGTAGAGSGGSWDCPSCPAFNDDPYNPDVVRGRSNARNAGNKKPGSSSTPSTNPFDFEHTTINGRKAFKNRNTGEIFVLDTLHKDHYEVYKDKNAAERGARTRDVWTDGRPKRTF